MFIVAVRMVVKLKNRCVGILSKHYYFYMLLIPELSCEFSNWTSCCGGWERSKKQGTGSKGNVDLGLLSP